MNEVAGAYRGITFSLGFFGHIALKFNQLMLFLEDLKKGSGNENEGKYSIVMK